MNSRDMRLDQETQDLIYSMPDEHFQNLNYLKTQMGDRWQNRYWKLDVEMVKDIEKLSRPIINYNAAEKQKKEIKENQIAQVDIHLLRLEREINEITDNKNRIAEQKQKLLNQN